MLTYFYALAGALYGVYIFFNSIIVVQNSKEDLNFLMLSTLFCLSVIFGFIWPLGLALDIYVGNSEN